MSYQKPEIFNLSKALAMVRGSSNKTSNEQESQGPPDLGSTCAYEADE